MFNISKIDKSTKDQTELPKDIGFSVFRKIKLDYLFSIHPLSKLENKDCTKLLLKKKLENKNTTEKIREMIHGNICNYIDLHVILTTFLN